MKKLNKRILSLFMAMIIMIMSFSAVTAFAASFNDINEEHWAYASVDQLVNEGTINGYDDGSFRPNGTVTRAEYIT